LQAPHLVARLQALFAHFQLQTIHGSDQRRILSFQPLHTLGVQRRHFLHHLRKCDRDHTPSALSTNILRGMCVGCGLAVSGHEVSEQ
jgi:hypothetical protein